MMSLPIEPDDSLVKQLLALPQGELEALLDSLEPQEAQAIIDDWSLWALPYQRIPDGVWRYWVMRAGRGTGKTHAGAKTTNEVAKDRDKVQGGLIGIMARTYDDARFTLIEGQSGILATAPADFRPVWSPGNKELVWPNGVRGRTFASEAPKKMRGPNFAWVWADEIEHWEDAQKTWNEVVTPAIRIGWARAMLTSTPLKGSKILKEIEARKRTVVSRAGTKDNPFLPADVRAEYYELFEGTRIGRQELDGEIIDEVDGALWTLDMIERSPRPEHLRRVVVAVDPAGTEGSDAAEHGIVVVGEDEAGKFYVLADLSRHGSPSQWAGTAVALYRKWRADAIVAEINYGGAMVKHTIQTVDPMAKVKVVRATRGKFIRAEPISALYERHKVKHVGIHAELEEQMVSRKPGDTEGFDRFDAMVWGLTELAIENPSRGGVSAYL